MIPKTKKQIGPYRSKFELDIATDLEVRGVTYEYETKTLSFLGNVYNGKCLACRSTKVGSKRRYTPDFYLPSSNIYIEAKGRFTPSNRTKMLAVKRDNPSVDLRMLFQADNWITQKKITKYSEWCDANGFKYSFHRVPEEWIN